MYIHMKAQPNHFIPGSAVTKSLLVPDGFGDSKLPAGDASANPGILMMTVTHATHQIRIMSSDVANTY